MKYYSSLNLPQLLKNIKTILVCEPYKINGRPVDCNLPMAGLSVCVSLVTNSYPTPCNPEL